MASTVKVELRRTVMTPRGRKFPPRKVEVFDLRSSSATREDGSRTEEEFDLLQEFVTSRFPGLRGRFMILAKDEAGELVPCKNQAELLKVIQQAAGSVLQLYVQELGNWQQEKSMKMQEVQCSCCGAAIDGRITKCLECEHFNLCNQCDEKNIHDHHVMVRAERQRFINFALPLFKEMLPKLCEEVREKNASKHLPRVEPREFRQFIQREKENSGDGMKDEQSLTRRQFRQGGPFCVKRGFREYEEEIHCSNCNETIKGLRVKCLECDVNLCDQCDDQGIHGNHVMVRSERPRFFNHGLLMVEEIIPKLCEEKRRNAKAGFIPRLTQKDVFQYWRQNRSESGDGENHPFQMRREQMRKRWCRFLNAISTDKATMAEDEEMSETNETTPEAVRMSRRARMRCRETNGEKREQMRRQWFQRCHQQWRQQMCRSREMDGDDGKCHRRMWKSFMGNCWRSWQQEMGEEKMGNRRRIRKGTEGCHPRRQWMKNCWKMWQVEAEKNKNRWINDGSEKSEESGQETGSSYNVMMRRGLFPGYHFLMMKSWRMMQEEMSSDDDLKSDTSPNKNDEKTKPGDDECSMRPAVAKHMLKQCWVNGCRELWWTEAERVLNAEEDEGKKGAAGRKLSEVCHVDVMKVMIARCNWRPYMQKCWLLWKQLQKKAGFLECSEAEGSKRLEAKSSSVEEHPKGKWIKACWPIWLEEMTKQCQSESENCGRGNRVKWNKRPFAGWHPLIIQSWRMMQEYLNEKEKPSKEKEMKEMQSLKRAHTKMIEKEMKRLSLEEKEMETKAAGSDVGDDHRAAPSHVDSMAGDQFVQIRDKVLKQYFEMWKEREEMLKKGEVMEWESPNTTASSPLLRLTLSLKEKPENEEHQ